MSTFEAKLSADGMKNLLISKQHNDFTFIIGDRRYECSWIVADFLSPKLANLHSVDPSITEYIVETIDSETKFATFLSLGCGSTIVIQEEDRKFLLSLCRELCNSELYALIIEHFTGELTISQALERLSDFESFRFDCNRSISFIASHFFELSPSDLSEIPFSALYPILSHDSLQLSSEDSLYDFISSQLSIDRHYFELFEFVRFEFLSTDCISRFISMSFDHFEILNANVWKAICARLILPVSQVSQNPRLWYDEFVCDLKEDKSLDGIISYLTKKHGGNVHNQGIVTITAKSIADNPNRLTNAANLGDNARFASKDEKNQWVCWDFHGMRVRPTHYSIRNQTGPYFLKSWIVESSIDGMNWREIDRRTDNKDLTSNYAVASFSVSNATDCRFIRLTQSATHNGSHELEFCALEIFGTVRMESQ
jgi:hypothetical protein